MQYKILTPEDLNPTVFVNDKTFQKGGISIALSKDNGNLLSIRNDGLYYGITPEKKYANLYLSNSGNDSAAGTRADPIRTLKEAFTRQKINTGITIHLMEGQVFEWRSSWGIGMTRGKQFIIQTYGESVDLAYINNTPQSVNYLRAKDVNRATVRFICDSQVDANGAMAIPQVFETSAPMVADNQFRAVILDTTAAEPNNVRIVRHFAAYLGSASWGQQFTFIGCQFNLRSQIALLSIGGDSSINIDTCQFTENSDAVLAHIHKGLLSLTIVGNGQTDGEKYNPNLHKRATPTAASWKRLFDGIRGVASTNVLTNAFN